METIRLRTHVGDDGLLRLETPVDIPNADYDIVVVYSIHLLEQTDWQTFIDSTYSSLVDDPLENV